jgi:bifunctional non-homologous end joining protein LigD
MCIEWDMANDALLRFGRFSFKASNLDKVLFPDDGITKGEIIEYYQGVAEAMLPHVMGRPLSLYRFPNGIQNEGFFQQHISRHFPNWIHRATVAKEQGKVTHVVANNTATLAYLANQGCIEFHSWLSRIDKPDNPDQLIFDLDPSNDDFSTVRSAAFALRELLAELGLVAFLKTTGSRGLHVGVPLDRKANFDTVRDFAQDAAKLLSLRDPENLTVEQRKVARGQRIYIDVFRNAYAQTGGGSIFGAAKPNGAGLGPTALV